MSTHWTIDTGRSDGGIVANGLLADSLPEYTRGESISLTFGFWTDASLSTGHTTRYENLREYGDHAGALSIRRAVDGTPRYVEQLPADASVSSLVVDLKPDSSLQSTPGLWVAITGYSDATAYPGAQESLALEATVLAELSEYQDRTAVENALAGGSVVP